MKVHNMPLPSTNPEAVKDTNPPQQSAARQSTRGWVKLYGHQVSSPITNAPRPPVAKGFLGKMHDRGRKFGSKLHDKLRHPKPMPRLPSPGRLPSDVFGLRMPGINIAPTRLSGDLSRLVGISLEAAKKMAETHQAREVRILSPNSCVTLDYRGDRLNLHVNDSGVVTRANWG